MDKRGELFNEYLTATRLRMEKDGSVVIEKDALEKVMEQALPGGPLGPPTSLPGQGQGTREAPRQIEF